jgi:hypothetical protein
VDRLQLSLVLGTPQGGPQLLLLACTVTPGHLRAEGHLVLGAGRAGRVLRELRQTPGGWVPVRGGLRALTARLTPGVYLHTPIELVRRAKNGLTQSTERSF